MQYQTMRILAWKLCQTNKELSENNYRIIKVRGKNKKPRPRIRIINKRTRPVSAYSN